MLSERFAHKEEKEYIILNMNGEKHCEKNYNYICKITVRIQNLII